MPGKLRGHDNSSDNIRKPSSPSNSHVNNTANTTDVTDIVHIGRKSHNECALITTTTGDKLQKALCNSGACKCVLSFVTIVSLQNIELNCPPVIEESKLLMVCSSPTKENV